MILSTHAICGISAPSRASTTLINYVGLDSAIIDYVCEIVGSLKIGKCMPGTLIRGRVKPHARGSTGLHDRPLLVHRSRARTEAASQEDSKAS
jgi:C-methyltransferase C-terminal domain